MEALLEAVPQELRAALQLMQERVREQMREEMEAFMARASEPPASPSEQPGAGDSLSHPPVPPSLTNEQKEGEEEPQLIPAGSKRTSNDGSMGNGNGDPGAVTDPTSQKRRMLQSRDGKYDVTNDSDPLGGLERAIDKGLQAGLVQLPLAFRDIFVGKRGSGLRTLVPYSESSCTWDNVVPATLSSKDKGVAPFHETWGLTNLSLIHLAWKDALLRAAEEYGNASSTLPSVGLGGLLRSAVSAYVNGLLEASVTYLESTREYPSPLAASVYYQLMDKLTLEKISRSSMWALVPTDEIRAEAARALEVLRHQPLEASRIMPSQYKLCPIHGANFDHDARICPFYVPPNQDRTVSPAPHVGFEALKECCTLRRPFLTSRISWRALPVKVGSTAYRDATMGQHSFRDMGRGQGVSYGEPRQSPQPRSGSNGNHGRAYPRSNDQGRAHQRSSGGYSRNRDARVEHQPNATVVPVEAPSVGPTPSGR